MFRESVRTWRLLELWYWSWELKSHKFTSLLIYEKKTFWNFLYPKSNNNSNNNNLFQAEPWKVLLNKMSRNLLFHFFVFDEKKQFCIISLFYVQGSIKFCKLFIQNNHIIFLKSVSSQRISSSNCLRQSCRFWLGLFIKQKSWNNSKFLVWI